VVDLARDWRTFGTVKSMMPKHFFNSESLDYIFDFFYYISNFGNSFTLEILTIVDIKYIF